MKLYLIHGFFCEIHAGLATKMVPIDGVTAVVREEAIPVMFAGLITHRDLNEANPLIGSMTDEIGKAELSEIVITKDEVRFLKIYDGRQQSKGISYVLHRDGNTWVGEYSLTAASGRPLKGPARCVITEVDQSLFQRDLEQFVTNHRAERGFPEA